MKITNTKIAVFGSMLENGKTVDFIYRGFFYEIFPSLDIGYVVNIYSHNEKDEYGNYMDEFLIDGGLCTGSAEDAISFML